jgi:segregation and condensation protein B
VNHGADFGRSFIAADLLTLARGLSRTERERARWRTSANGASTVGGSARFRRSPKLARIEAALIVADGPVTARKLAVGAALLETAEALRLIEELNSLYDESGSAFRVERAGGGFQLLTRPVYARWLDRIHQRQERLRLSAPALETLTVIAYRQPMTRADIESVRGVQAAEMLKQLMERGLVKIVGEHDSLGRPYLYGTTRLFLETYGLQSLDELPQADVLRRPQSRATAPEPAAARAA